MWVAPEQRDQHLEPHPRCDVWALGLLTFYLYTGKSYWLSANRNVSIVAFLEEIASSAIEAPSVRARALSVEPALPAGFDDWFFNMVHRDPKERFETARAAFDAFVTLIDQRRSARYRFWLPIQTSTKPMGVAIIHDGSDTGLLCVSRDEPAENSRVTLKLDLPDALPPVALDARVVRVRRNDDDPASPWRYKVALCFENPVPGLGERFGQVDRLMPN
jgi:serine/threonine protein kinase